MGVQGRVGDNISIHALRVEGDYHLFSDCPFLIRFLSTPSGWRATIVEKSIRSTFFDFYPRPPGGGRPKNAKLLKNRHQRFLSTPSGWRATRSAVKRSATARISIHALRVEGDAAQARAR